MKIMYNDGWTSQACSSAYERAAFLYEALELKYQSRHIQRQKTTPEYAVGVPGVATDIAIPVQQSAYGAIQLSQQFAGEHGHVAAMQSCEAGLDAIQEGYYKSVDAFIGLQQPEFEHQIPDSSEDAFRLRMQLELEGKTPGLHTLSAQISRLAPLSAMALTAWSARHADNAGLPLIARRYTDDLLSMLPERLDQYYRADTTSAASKKLIRSLAALSLSASMSYVRADMSDTPKILDRMKARHRARQRGVVAYKVMLS